LQTAKQAVRVSYFGHRMLQDPFWLSD